MASLSVRSTSDSSFSASASSFASTSSSSSVLCKYARVRTPPRRGQIKAAIFASVFASIARFLGVTVANEEGLNADFSPDVSVNSSPASSSGMPPGVSQSHAFDGRLHLQV